MKNYFTITELAQLLCISRVAVFKKIKSGQIKAEKIGHIFVIPKSEFENVLGNTLSQEDKLLIDAGIHKTIKEYSKTLELLGSE